MRSARRRRASHQPTRCLLPSRVGVAIARRGPRVTSPYSALPLVLRRVSAWLGVPRRAGGVRPLSPRPTEKRTPLFGLLEPKAIIVCTGFAATPAPFFFPAADPPRR